MSNRSYGVWLHHQRIGTIFQRGDYTWFRFSDDYIEDSDRSVLGLTFEEDLHRIHTAMLRLPPWFSNLLPEGRLREWIALDRGVSADREMELLAQVGQDLPGAVQVVKEEREPDFIAEPLPVAGEVLEQLSAGEFPWRFSLAGVSLKFSMLRTGDRLTLPAYGEGGDWIVKLPDLEFRDVPRNEYAMMSLAAKSGIEVPEHMLIHRDQLENLPSRVWPGNEEYAYAVRRFDRDARRDLIHIEDFAQVRNIYPYGRGKYQGNFETVASLAYRRGQDMGALRQVARRLAFNILISNGDAHLKNWSLIYSDKRKPTLAPAYDLVSTEFYRLTGYPEDLGLRFGKTRSFVDVALGTFSRLERKLDAKSAGLVECVVDTVDRVTATWPDVAWLLDENTALRDSIDTSIHRRRGSILRR